MNEQTRKPAAMTNPRVVIVGAGFGGMEVAKRLDAARAEIVLIDRVNHHLFQPLLYQVATAALSPSDIATANRTLLRREHVRIVMADVTGVDTAGSAVLLDGGGREPFDYLVLATGAAYSFFGNDGWREHAFVLKSLDDALSIRNHLLGCLEKATRATVREDICRLLTFVVVGGGPTGVELAGTIAEFVNSVIPRDFPSLSRTDARVILCEGTDRLLSSFTDRQSAYALHTLRSLGVAVKFGHNVDDVTGRRVDIGGERIDTATILWCAGTKARPAAEWLGVPPSGHGGVTVAADCSVDGMPNVFTIGDASTCTGKNGKPLPGLAPVAKQQGRFVAKLLNARIRGRPEPDQFRYRDWGALAVIGRSRAVASFGDLHLTGFPAWLTWALVHLALLVDFRSRVLVYVNWTWDWLHSNRGVRLIVGPSDRPRR